MNERTEIHDQILSILYQLKQQGVTKISSAHIMLILGVEEEEIPSDHYGIMLSLDQDAELEAELATARLMNNIH